MLLKLFVPAAALLGAAVAAGAVSAAPADGAAQFAQNCAACHQPQGQGIPGAFPALAGNKFVAGDPKGPAWVVTHGRGGMPNFAEDLTDDDVAGILTFVRANWGNKAPAIDAATVASVRSSPAPPDTAAGLPFH